ncbi:type III-A CRISPR-associated protein Cas10/Csm1 [Thermocrinis jamiesonii]|uniref:type III-A CRISPR-associated protein Cas10/Csm1 n=1 Tax=Thermocrinis jamiesonii TaxID=1302351 RepID=UPI00049766A3|nr:type III-A CRISPR-associated protein Cas10/Csm1 [Thermocrinis jamiesonii]
MEKLEIRSWLAIGGLLHDIGKLIDRAGEERAEEEERRKFKYAHAVYSYKFLEELLERKGVSQEVQELILSGAYHHNPEPNNLYHIAQQIADHCASSERSRREEQSVDQTTQRKEEKRLKSIFGLVDLECAKTYLDGEKHEYELEPLKLEKEVIFPKDASQIGTSGVQKYKDLLQALKTHLSKLDFKDPQKTLTKLYYLLYKYLWCVPASTYDKERGTNHFPDISLFDHLRVASALVSSLWTDYNKERLNGGLNAVEFLLVEGDITGIQRFLYQLSNIRGVGKRLRGRSFFLSVLPIILGRFFLKELEYPMVNLLYAGGGKFQLIIGYEEGIEKKLEELQRKVDEVLVREFGGHLGVVLGWLRLKGSDLGVGTLGEKIHELYEEVGRKKFQKFSTILENFDKLANPFGPDNYEVCPSCQTNLKPESQEFCNWCELFQEVGAKIPRAEYVVFSPEMGDLYLEDIGGVSVYSKDQVAYTLPEDTLLLLNSTDFEDKADGFFFLANTVPLEEDGSVKDFNELVEEEEEGYKLLAFVKMDVDNLGLIFSQGLKKDYSLSRVATLSRSLELFFSGYINTLLEQKQFKNKVYVVYSGGDDLFFCAPWETALEVAKELEKDFSAYTCYNPCFTLSAGVFFQRPNYPIRFSADGAEQEKEHAKVEKNCISLWKEPLPWEKFRYALEELKRFLANFDAPNHRTLLYRIYTLLKANKRGNGISMRFYPMFYYQLYRNIKEEEQQRELESLILDPGNNYNIKDYAELILKLVLMKTRGMSEKTKNSHYINNNLGG